MNLLPAGYYVVHLHSLRNDGNVSRLDFTEVKGGRRAVVSIFPEQLLRLRACLIRHGKGVGPIEGGQVRLCISVREWHGKHYNTLIKIEPVKVLAPVAVGVSTKVEVATVEDFFA
jgi:hypothetical protein